MTQQNLSSAETISMLVPNFSGDIPGEYKEVAVT
jgi:hypothetical protein